MSFLLVKWVGEPAQFSVVKKSNLCDGELRHEDKSLLGKLLPIIWGRNKRCMGTIINLSDDQDSLNDEADDLAFKAASEDIPVPEKKRKRGGRKEPASTSTQHSKNGTEMDLSAGPSTGLRRKKTQIEVVKIIDSVVQVTSPPEDDRAPEKKRKRGGRKKPASTSTQNSQDGTGMDTSVVPSTGLGRRKTQIEVEEVDSVVQVTSPPEDDRAPEKKRKLGSRKEPASTSTQNSQDGTGMDFSAGPSVGLYRNNTQIEVENIDSVMKVTPPVENSEAGPEIDIPLEEGYKAKYKNLKKKYRILKQKHKELIKETDSEAMVELIPDSGVYVKREDLSSAKLVSTQMTILARNLFRTLFTSEELSSHSLFGKPCKSNREKVPLPEIDAARRDAVIRFALKDYGIEQKPLMSKNERKCLKNGKAEIHKSLSHFLREEARSKSCSAGLI